MNIIVKLHKLYFLYIKNICILIYFYILLRILNITILNLKKKIDVYFIIVLLNPIECVLMLPQENWLNHDDIRFVIFHNIFAPHTLAYSTSEELFISLSPYASQFTLEDAY